MRTKGTEKYSVLAWAGALSLAVVALGASSAALAGDVFWSVGLSSPGAQFGVFSPQPVYVQPQPYYVQTQPVYSQPQVIYTQPRPVYVQPQPVYVQPQPVYVRPSPIFVQPQPVVVYNGWHHPRHGWRYGPGPNNQQIVQTYPVQYQIQQPVYGYGDRLR